MSRKKPVVINIFASELTHNLPHWLSIETKNKDKLKKIRAKNRKKWLKKRKK